MTSSIELAEMATPDRPLPPAIAEELAVRSGGHPLLLRSWPVLPPGGGPGRAPVDRRRACRESDRPAAPAQRSLLRRAAVLGDEFPEDLLLQMFRDVAPERSGTELLAGLSGLIVSTGHQLRFRHPILREVAYAGLPYKRRRELHAKAAEVLEATTAAADRRPEILALHYFVARNYDKAMDYGWRAGERAMARYAPLPPPTPTEGRPRLPDFPRRQPERAFVLPGSAGRCRVWRAGPRGCRSLPGSAAGVRGQPLREASGAQANLVEQRRGHYTNALRRASLGCAQAARQVRRRAPFVPVASPLRVLPAPTGSLRGCPPVGGARPRRSRGGP